MRIVLILSLFLLTLNLWAQTIHATDNPTGNTADSTDDCSPRDLNAELGEIRDQSNVGWCFANTAADLLTIAHKNEFSHFFNQVASQKSGDHGTKNQSRFDLQASSVYTALTYFSNTTDHGKNHNLVFNGGGLIFEALKSVEESNSICSQKMDHLLMTKGYNVELREKFLKFQEIYLSYHQYKKSNSDGDKAAFYKLMGELKTQGTFLNAFDGQDIQQALEKDTIEDSAMDLLQLVCNNNKIQIQKKSQYNQIISYNDGTGNYYNSETKSIITFETYLSIINNTLTKNRPVGISYPVEKVLTDPQFVTGAHASTISGRQLKINSETKNKECFYQIRNSWGRNCRPNIDHNGKVYYNHKIYRYLCENGTFWVPRSDLKGLVQAIVYQTD